MLDRSTAVPERDGVSPQPLIARRLAGLVARRRFRAMNTDVEIVAVDWRQSALLASAAQIFVDIEARFSRFRADSELSLLNARAGEDTAVSPQLLQIIERAIYFHRLTGGVFDPAILPDLEAAGYDRSFELVSPTAAALAARHAPRHASIADVRIDRQRRALTAPRDVRIDLGGIGKGHAVDAAAHALTPARDFMINAGGDIFASGNSSEGHGWPVAVSDPADEQRDLDVVILRDEAIATSTIARRRWQRGDAWHTHIIDPRTGLSVDNDVVSVSVIAPTATEADVFAKTALLLGAGDGTRFLDKRNTSGLFVLSDGAVHRTAGWPGAGGGIDRAME
jgi:thiamine biosynthesis lipoprotein